jgi:hypothetical protein
VKLGLLFLLSACVTHAETYSGKAAMNGISYSDFSGFEEKWKFVTVRYRTDTREERFVWGNAAAIKALESGSVDFPDGAVFAKIGFMTDEDPAFKSSRVPSGALRYQFMVRDKVKYASTGGWGYALFDANKVTMERDPVQESQACYACHQLAADRGQVFSTLLKFNPFAYTAAAKPAGAPEKAADVPAAVKFDTVALQTVPEQVRKSAPTVKELRSVKGELRKFVFKGTIDEIRPSLIEEARRTGLPAALIASNSPHFALVYPDKKPRKNCIPAKSMKSVFTTTVPSSGGGEPLYVVAYQDLCQ